MRRKAGLIQVVEGELLMLLSAEEQDEKDCAALLMDMVCSLYAAPSSSLELVAHSQLPRIVCERLAKVLGGAAADQQKQQGEVRALEAMLSAGCVPSLPVGGVLLPRLPAAVRDVYAGSLVWARYREGGGVHEDELRSALTSCYSANEQPPLLVAWWMMMGGVAGFTPQQQQPEEEDEDLASEIWKAVLAGGGGGAGLLLPPFCPPLPQRVRRRRAAAAAGSTDRRSTALLHWALNQQKKKPSSHVNSDSLLFLCRQRALQEEEEEDEDDAEEVCLALCVLVGGGGDVRCAAVLLSRTILPHFVLRGSVAALACLVVCTRGGGHAFSRAVLAEMMARDDGAAAAAAAALRREFARDSVAVVELVYNLATASSSGVYQLARFVDNSGGGGWLLTDALLGIAAAKEEEEDGDGDDKLQAVHFAQLTLAALAPTSALVMLVVSPALVRVCHRALLRSNHRPQQQRLKDSAWLVLEAVAFALATQSTTTTTTTPARPEQLKLAFVRRSDLPWERLLTAAALPFWSNLLALHVELDTRHVLAMLILIASAATSSEVVDVEQQDAAAAVEFLANLAANDALAHFKARMLNEPRIVALLQRCLGSNPASSTQMAALRCVANIAACNHNNNDNHDSATGRTKVRGLFGPMMQRMAAAAAAGGGGAAAAAAAASQVLDLLG